MNEKIYFFADVHFKGTSSDIEDKKFLKFQQFVRKLIQDNIRCSVYVMGDLFDYYFEKKTLIANKNYKRVFMEFDKLRKHNIQPYFIAGNHDFWIGKEFKKNFINCFLEDHVVTINNKNFYLTHGDGILSWDRKYRILKKVIRSRIFIILYSLLPGIIAEKIGKTISEQRKDSHKLDDKVLEKIQSELKKFAERKWQDGNDWVIMGHYHHLFQFSNHKGKGLLVLGDCDEIQFNYAVFDGENLLVEKI
jgi:UDP-2,3-diacylglucosamine hydrolase